MITSEPRQIENKKGKQMNLIIDENSTIKKLNFKKNIEFINDMQMAELLAIVDEVRKGRYEFSKLMVIANENKIKYICNPRAPHDDIFFVEKKDGLKIFTTIYKNAVEFADTLTLDDEAKNFFLLNSVCPPGRTFFNEIKRLEPGSIIRGTDCIEIEYIQNTCKKANVSDVTYDEFKTKFESYIKSKVQGKKVGILLSGGLDSTSVALAVKKYALSLRAYTMDYIPAMRGVKGDLHTAIRTAKDLNIPLEVCEIDFNNYPISRYLEYVDLMPMAVGLIPGFDSTIKKVSDDGVDLILTGQNADWLYWLSATSKFSLTRAGFASLFRRLFLNEDYFKFVLHKEGKIQLNLSFVAVYSFVEYFSALVYSVFKRKVFLPPSNTSEAIHAFAARPDVVVFIAKDERTNVHKININSSIEFYQELISIVIKKNMMLPDSQIIRRAADIQNIDVLFPFSSESLMNIWMNKIPKLKELFTHKYFIKKYVTENYPEYGSKNNKSYKEFKNKGIEEQSWAQIVLRTNKTLNKIYSENNNSTERMTNYRKLIFSIALLWIDKIKSYR